MVCQTSMSNTKKNQRYFFFKHILWNLWLYYMFLNSAYFSFFNGGHTNARSTDRSTVEDMADMVVHRFVLHAFFPRKKIFFLTFPVDF